MPQATPFPFTPPEPPKPPPKPVVTKISPGVYRVGDQITIEAKERRVRFPGKVNMNKELIEFFCVTEMGRVHEAVLSTTVVPSHLHMAVLLIGNGEIPEPSATDWNESPPKGREVAVTVAWNDEGGERVSHPASRLITHLGRKASPPDGTWIYTSSRINEGRYLADAAGDVIAVIECADSLINIRDADRANDEVWVANEELLPAVGTPVEVILTLPPKPTAGNAEEREVDDPASRNGEEAVHASGEGP